MAYGLIIQRRLDHMLQSVRDGLEWVSGIKWNRCPESPGMGVRNAPEYARILLNILLTIRLIYPFSLALSFYEIFTPAHFISV
jgi:hypothetical protein